MKPSSSLKYLWRLKYRLNNANKQTEITQVISTVDDYYNTGTVDILLMKSGLINARRYLVYCCKHPSVVRDHDIQMITSHYPDYYNKDMHRMVQQGDVNDLIGNAIVLMKKAMRS